MTRPAGLTATELAALPVGTVVVPIDREDWPRSEAMRAGWEKVGPPGPNGSWDRIDRSDGVVTTGSVVLENIGVKLRDSL